MQAVIRFKGKAFHTLKWCKILTNLGFRVVGPALGKAFYSSGGNNILLEAQGFIARDEEQGCEWLVSLKQTRKWEGTIKFYSVLLCAFSMPQIVEVTFAESVFAERKSLCTFAEAAIFREFPKDELEEFGVYRKGDGLQFG
jgi:hypothetical protein